MSLKKVTRTGVYGVAVKGTNILLVHKGSKGIYRGLLDLPGGGIEFGETHEQALRREFFEEVGMSFDSMHLLDSLSHCQECHHEDPPFMFHQLGNLYEVRSVQPSSHHIAQDGFNWYEIEKLQCEQLTPFASEVVRRLKNGFRGC